MSGLAAIYHIDGRPVPTPLLRSLTDSLIHRGPDGEGLWADGPVALGFRALHTTAESLGERQPVSDDSGAVSLVLDGRIDNRDELRTGLHAHGVRVRTSGDAELVLRAFQCWGESCPERILGDYVFVIWDRACQRLFCARDPVGVKPLYYCYANHRTFVCGSEIHALFLHEDVRREPNEGMIGEYLAQAISHREETLFKGVLRLPAGCCASVGRHGLRVTRYWNFNPGRAIEYRHDSEYAEHFGSIFHEAVGCRLRTHEPVGVELSGGLDSSSVVGVAQAIGRCGAANVRVETFSMTFPGLPCDETSYIQEVVRSSRATSNIICGSQRGNEWFWTDIDRYADLPDYPNSALFYPVRTRARQRGIRVILTGFGGDEWLGGSYYQYADLLRRGRFMAFVRQVRYGSGGQMFGTAMRFGVWPLLPMWMRGALRRILRRDPVPPWIDRRFARAHDLRERLSAGTTLGTNAPMRFSSLSQRGLFLSATSAWQSHMLELEDRTAASFAVEERHPFLDRRIAEFALAIPEDQRWRARYHKYVLRQAMKGLLPERVRTRTGKADFSHAFADALASLGRRGFFDRLAIEARGWIDGAPIRRMYDRMIHLYARHDDRYAAYTWPLWTVAAVEGWLLKLTSGAR